MFRCDVAQGSAGNPDRVTIDVEASGFLRHMARIIAGTLIAVGRGHRRPEDMAGILAAHERRAAGHRAPACGLTLEWIAYRQDDLQTVRTHTAGPNDLPRRMPVPDL
jgi:tRNA pseudouridine38-40 synthase